MKRRMIAAVLLACCLLLAAALAEGEGGVRRALLVGCDVFVSHDDLTPSAALNVERMARLLQTDARGYAVLARRDAGVPGVEALLDAVAETFAEAEADDVSLLYICTHGMYDRVSYEALLALSDGKTEENISAAQLRKALDQVPGEKIIILDACNSGAFIGKGALDDVVKNAFTGPDYRVLTSAGAYENSFVWHDRQSMGGGYFTQELCEGLCSRAFDLDADGAVTLTEAYQGLLESHGASTVQAYPQRAETALYAYDPLEKDGGERPLGEIWLDTFVLADGEDTLYFSYTVRRPVRVQYQIIYCRGGQWRFDMPQIVEDEENAAGALSPGRKERSVTLVAEDGDPYGYVLLQIVAQEGRYAMLAGSCLIAAQPWGGDPRLNVRCAASFAPRAGEELHILVNHAFPCSLTVRVLDGAGATVRRLAYKAPSRPTGQAQEASFFYWDGRDDAGEAVPAGAYTVEVTCAVGGTQYRARSGLVSVADWEEERRVEAAFQALPDR